VRNSSKKEENENVSYDSNTKNAYSNDDSYASSSGRKYGGGADGNVTVKHSEVEVGKRDDFVKVDGRDFISPELRNQNDDYSTARDRAYNPDPVDSINKKDLGRKRDKF